MSDARRLEVGRVGRAHGLRGEVAVTFSSDRAERTVAGAEMVAIDDGGRQRELVVATARPHQGRWLVQFEGIGDRTSAETLRGCTLLADELPGAADELRVHALVGAAVVDDAGEMLGRVAAVEANPAHDLLVLESGALVPVTFVVRHEAGRVVVDLPEGLLEL